MAEARSTAVEWETFHQQVRRRVTPAAWQTWIEPLDSSIEEGSLHLVAPTDFHYRWVGDRYLPALQEAAMDTLGLEVELTVVPVVDEPPVGVSSGPSPRQSPLPIDTIDPTKTRVNVPRLVPKYTFDNFVVGQSNRFAHAAALAVAEQPGGHYNPLFIYANAGLGKTHLLHAVGHHSIELNPGAVVRYVSSEQFFNEFINGIRRKRMDEFKERYRTIDVLLLDDVQFFEGKEQILEEFFHTFNSLYEAGKQVVISSDRHPKHLSTLEDRLRSRFEWGLLTDIQSPDIETRLAILRKNAEFAPAPVPPEVMTFIAENVHQNIRELEGALTRVTAFASLTDEQITLTMAKEVLSDIVESERDEPLTSSRIIQVTADYTSMTIEELTGPSRTQPLARFRQIAMYLCREHTDLSLPKIGAQFGGRDHTTVIHAVERVKTLMRTDMEVFDQVSDLGQLLRTT
ncbi:MAG: chromosomal replication initiator protein DnaA [Actinomycetota bacterium]|nr:chromosomal replication initiator protein DnaA [Actinomycetota bacterium]